MRLRKVLHLLTFLLCALVVLSCSSTNDPVKAGPNAPPTSGVTHITGVPVKVRPNAPLQSATPGPSIRMHHAPFRDYDDVVAKTIKIRWKDLLSQMGPETRPESADVVVEFKLQEDGKVSDVNITRNEAGELFGGICRQAIVESAPFPRWPSDMKQVVTRNFREVTFTFHYE